MVSKVLAGLFIGILIAGVVLTGCAAPAPPVPKTTPTPTPTPAPTPAKVIELKFAHSSAVTNPDVADFAVPYAKEVEKRTNGQIKVTVFGGGALGPGAAAWDLINNRTCDIAWFGPYAYAGKAPLADFVTLPVGLRAGAKTQDGKYILDVIADKYLTESHFKNLKVLMYAQYAMCDFVWTKNPSKTLEDNKGRIVGYTGGANYAKLLPILGLTPEKVPFTDIYTSLEKKIVDGFYTGLQGVASYRIVPVIKGITMNAELGTDLCLLAMNKDVWNSLSPELQKTMEECNNWGKEIYYAMVARENSRGLQMAKDGGVEIYALPEAERARWLQAASSIPDEWAKDMDGKGLPGTSLLNDLRQLLAKMK